jgi:hypothetical protein
MKSVLSVETFPPILRQAQFELDLQAHRSKKDFKRFVDTLATPCPDLHEKSPEELQFQRTQLEAHII